VIKELKFKDYLMKKNQKFGELIEENKKLKK